MPIIISTPAPEDTQEADASALQEALFTADGLTIEGQILEGFLSIVDWEDILEGMEDVADVTTATVVEDADGDLIESAEGEPVEFTTLPGEIMVEAVDMDDLSAMFESYVHDMAEATIEDRVYKASALAMIGEGELDEAKGAWGKKGFMVKVRKGALKTQGGGTGPGMVNRMLGAMIAKGAISRKTSASAYKAPGAKTSSYTKGGTKGAGQGTFNREPADAAIRSGKVSYGQGAQNFPYYTKETKAAAKSAKSAAKGGKKAGGKKIVGKKFKASLTKKASEVKAKFAAKKKVLNKKIVPSGGTSKMAMESITESASLAARAIKAMSPVV